METVVDSLQREYDSISKFLEESKETSLASDLNKHFKKILVLSSASYFESEIYQILIECITQKTNNDSRIVNFLKKKAISQQYHTYFSWGEKNEPTKPGKNANSFFSLFGNEFKVIAAKEVENNVELGKSILAFLELGHLRNILVHSNFASYNLDTKTTEDIYSLYKNSLTFIEYIKLKLA